MTKLFAFITAFAFVAMAVKDEDDVLPDAAKIFEKAAERFGSQHYDLDNVEDDKFGRIGSFIETEKGDMGSPINASGAEAGAKAIKEKIQELQGQIKQLYSMHRQSSGVKKTMSSKEFKSQKKALVTEIKELSVKLKANSAYKRSRELLDPTRSNKKAKPETDSEQQRQPKTLPTSTKATCAIGDKVTAKYLKEGEGYGKMFDATIASMSDDGTITVNWADGDSSHRTMAAANVKKGLLECTIGRCEDNVAGLRALMNSETVTCAAGKKAFNGCGCAHPQYGAWISANCCQTCASAACNCFKGSPYDENGCPTHRCSWDENVCLEPGQSKLLGHTTVEW